MAKGRINKSSVDATKPGAGEVLLWDDKLAGFGLKVTPTGVKTYLFQYRLGGRSGKTRRFTIGKHGKLTPDAARKEAERLAVLVSQGVDPQQQKQDNARKAVDLAFKGYAQTFVDDCLKVRWKTSHKDGESLLRLYATPVLGTKPLHDITRADIRAVLQKAKGKVATSRNLFAVLRRLFRWAVSQGDIDVSPIAGMEPPPLPVRRDRVLSDQELKLAWNASAELGYPFGPLIRLLIITGQRVEEVSGLEWSELEKGKAMWTLPAERAKNGSASMVPLSTLAVAELNALAKRSKRKDGWPRTGFVFSTTGKTSVSGHSRAKRRLDREIAILAKKEEDAITVAPWRIHDLRRTLATGMQRLGVRFEVTEAILNHVSGSKSGVAGVYQLHDWGPEKKAALEAWSEHIESILGNTAAGNVIRLSSKRA
ncbi:tyrosine-type recombinase/integrase [Novosphingobium olei]|uniref:Integrase arm-type DNA-binding domain-containing protein n=1 Tax=Novosphingobium olei TaxID=2728851 RepID=A0A7Y0GBG8_9SPHN|nr:site-specific integrase [Novosphingobium olei]NML95153.1 integrase arm-type DNA-binding domain-containing protein [Novosphingobium olei]